MLKLEPQHPEHILANYCYDGGGGRDCWSPRNWLARVDFENSHDIGQYDSLGYVHLRMKQWDKAIADYNKALDGRPDFTLVVVWAGAWHAAPRAMWRGGNADIAAAARDEPDIANIMRRLGRERVMAGVVFS